MKILRCLLAASFGLFLFNVEAQAANKGQVVAKCSQALSEGDQEQAAQLAAEVGLLINIFSGSLKTGGVQCLDAVYGQGWYYDEVSGSFLNNDPMILQKSLAGLSDSDLQERKAKLDSVRKGIEERLLKADTAKIEKHVACVGVKISDAINDIRALDDAVNQANQSLIALDTYEACASLYETDKSAAMLNQNCIEAFKRNGHPNLQVDESAAKLILSNELNDLTELKDQLDETLLAARIKILEIDGAIVSGGIELAAKQAVEDKSCGEFGYENVYLDK